MLSTVLAKQTENQHPIDTFFKSMAESVKKLSPENQIRAKMHICQIVGQLELNEISSRPSLASETNNFDVVASAPTSSANTSVHATSPNSIVDDDVLNYMTNVSGKNFV